VRRVSICTAPIKEIGAIDVSDQLAPGVVSILSVYREPEQHGGGWGFVTDPYKFQSSPMFQRRSAAATAIAGPAIWPYHSTLAPENQSGLRLWTFAMLAQVSPTRSLQRTGATERRRGRFGPPVVRFNPFRRSNNFSCAPTLVVEIPFQSTAASKNDSDPDRLAHGSSVPDLNPRPCSGTGATRIAAVKRYLPIVSIPSDLE